MGLLSLFSKKIILKGIFHAIIKKKNLWTGEDIKCSVVIMFIPKELVGDNCVYYYWSQHIIKDFSVFEEIYKLQQDEDNFDESQLKCDKIEELNNIRMSMSLFDINGKEVTFSAPYLGGEGIYKGKLNGNFLSLSLFNTNSISKFSETIFENEKFEKVIP